MQTQTHHRYHSRGTGWNEVLRVILFFGRHQLENEPHVTFCETDFANTGDSQMMFDDATQFLTGLLQTQLWATWICKQRIGDQLYHIRCKTKFLPYFLSKLSGCFGQTTSVRDCDHHHTGMREHLGRCNPIGNSSCTLTFFRDGARCAALKHQTR